MDIQLRDFDTPQVRAAKLMLNVREQEKKKAQKGEKRRNFSQELELHMAEFAASRQEGKLIDTEVEIFLPFGVSKPDRDRIQRENPLETEQDPREAYYNLTTVDFRDMKPIITEEWGCPEAHIEVVVDDDKGIEVHLRSNNHAADKLCEALREEYGEEIRRRSVVVRKFHIKPYFYNLGTVSEAYKFLEKNQRVTS